MEFLRDILTVFLREFVKGNQRVSVTEISKAWRLVIDLAILMETLKAFLRDFDSGIVMDFCWVSCWDFALGIEKVNYLDTSTK